MIRNVIFDLGRVLLEFDPYNYLSRIYKDEKIVDSLMEHVFNNKEWIELDRGTIDIAGAVEKMVQRCPEYKNQIEQCMENWNELLVPIEGSVNILEKIKSAGYNTYILSNFHRKAYDYVSAKYDFFNLFDGGMLSCDAGLLKPEPGIYRQLIDQCSIREEESIFIDDMEKNVEAAEKAGIKSILFKNPPQLERELTLMGLSTTPTL